MGVRNAMNSPAGFSLRWGPMRLRQGGTYHSAQETCQKRGELMPRIWSGYPAIELRSRNLKSDTRCWTDVRGTCRRYFCKQIFVQIFHSLLPRDADSINLLADMHPGGCVLILTLSCFTTHSEGKYWQDTTATTKRGNGDIRLTEKSKANGVKSKWADYPNRFRVAIFIANILIKAIKHGQQHRYPDPRPINRSTLIQSIDSFSA